MRFAIAAFLAATLAFAAHALAVRATPYESGFTQFRTLTLVGRTARFGLSGRYREVDDLRSGWFRWDADYGVSRADLGATVSLRVARELVVYVKRTGGQLQYSEPLQFQTRANDGFAELATWMLAHLDGDLATEALAENASA